jgi:hypothetical protein
MAKAIRISAEATSVLVIKALKSFMITLDYLLCDLGAVYRSTAPTKSHTATLIMIKKTANDIRYVSFLRAKMTLPVQQTAAFSAPNTTTMSVILSIPCRIGVSTMTAKNTCPKLSRMFSMRPSCACVNSRLPNKEKHIDKNQIACLSVSRTHASNRNVILCNRVMLYLAYAGRVCVYEKAARTRKTS